MTVSISGQVPGDQLNGLIDKEEELLAERTPEAFLAVVVVERANRKYDDVKQVTSAVVRFRHIEPVEGEQEEAIARGLLERAYAQRTGEVTLPVPLDEPVELEVDLETPLAEGDGSFEPELEVAS